jgi:dTDP-4-dehydrorhamnose 3,5-epimerase
MAALNVEAFSVDGVLHVTPPRFGDVRGYFCETYNRGAFAAVGIDRVFVQDNQSLSRERGVVRGMHFQIPPFAQAKLVRVLRGSVYDVAVDIRKGSPTYGQSVAVTLSAELGNQLFIPDGFAHGFCTLEADTEVLYKVDAPYSRDHERGLLWNDPALGVHWPIADAQAIVLDRDRSHPRLAGLPEFF